MPKFPVGPTSSRPGPILLKVAATAVKFVIRLKSSKAIRNMEDEKMRIALIAHDKKKEEMIEFTKKNESILKKVELVSTGTTGLKVMENTDLKIYRYKSGPLGGDQQIGALVADHNIDMIIFLRDPLTSQPHEPDIMALLRLCDVYKVPLATNVASAQLLLDAIDVKL